MPADNAEIRDLTGLEKADALDTTEIVDAVRYSGTGTAQLIRQLCAGLNCYRAELAWMRAREARAQDAKLAVPIRTSEAMPPGTAALVDVESGAAVVVHGLELEAP